MNVVVVIRINIRLSAAFWQSRHSASINERPSVIRRAAIGSLQLKSIRLSHLSRALLTPNLEAIALLVLVECDQDGLIFYAHDLAKSGELKLIRIAGRTMVDGDSLRALLGVAA
jgi:hypothetical protein